MSGEDAGTGLGLKILGTTLVIVLGGLGILYASARSDRQPGELNFADRTPAPASEKVIADEATTVAFTVPASWSSERRPDAEFWLFDPASAGNGSASAASTGIQIGTEDRPEGDLAIVVTTRLHGDLNYRWVSSGQTTFGGLDAFRHEFTYRIEDTPLYITEVVFERPSAPGKIVRVQAYSREDADEATKALLRRLLESASVTA